MTPPAIERMKSISRNSSGKAARVNTYLEAYLTSIILTAFGVVMAANVFGEFVLGRRNDRTNGTSVLRRSGIITNIVVSDICHAIAASRMTEFLPHHHIVILQISQILPTNNVLAAFATGAVIGHLILIVIIVFVVTMIWSIIRFKVLLGIIEIAGLLCNR